MLEAHRIPFRAYGKGVYALGSILWKSFRIVLLFLTSQTMKGLSPSTEGRPF